jgi:hypothetical protein
MVVSGGKTKVAQYGQWDGYPEGQGLTALFFLKSTNLERFKLKLDQCRFGTTDELKKIYLQFTDNDYLTEEQHKRFMSSEYGHLSRDHGAKILGLILDSPSGLILSDQSDFAADSLFCEWCYVIDFDKNTFEVFKGCNHEPLAKGERFFNLNPSEPSKYYPVKKVAEFKLGSLPNKKKFLKVCRPDSE